MMWNSGIFLELPASAHWHVPERRVRGSHRKASLFPQPAPSLTAVRGGGGAWGGGSWPRPSAPPLETGLQTPQLHGSLSERYKIPSDLMTGCWTKLLSILIMLSLHTFQPVQNYLYITYSFRYFQRSFRCFEE